MFICQNCDFSAPKWLGKCPGCEEWNTFKDSSSDFKTRKNKKTLETQAKVLSEIPNISYKKMKSGIGEFDRVLGGGITEGSLILLGGEPGVGKSTLLMEACGKLSQLNKAKILYVSGEESIEQVADRARRLNLELENIFILNETSWQKILENIKYLKPALLILDSIQTTVTEESNSAAGSVSQVRDVTYELMNHVKATGLSCIVIGHITKDGMLAGPKVLEHMVDTVLNFEGDKKTHYRFLRSIKNRFGSSLEVGIFEMKNIGLVEVKNLSKCFLDENYDKSYGRAISCILEGSRPIFVEVQSLVIENKYANGRRISQGLDQNKLSVIIAVIEKYFNISISMFDVFINIAGGYKLKERDADLAIIISILSSLNNFSISQNAVFLGEIGLAGEIRPIPFLNARLNEINLLNYKDVYISNKSIEEIPNNVNLNLLGLNNVSELKDIFFSKS